MSNRVLWFTAVVGYVIQTKGLSIIQSNRFLSADAAMRGGHLSNLQHYSIEEMKSAMTIYLIFINCISLLLLMPLASFFKGCESNATTSNNDEDIATDSNSGSNNIEGYELQSMSSENHLDTVISPMGGDIPSTSTSISPNSASMNPPSSNLNSTSTSTSFFALSQHYNVVYAMKLAILASFLMVPIFTYMLALSLSPAFDVALIQNTSIFEIVTFLYGICGISRKKYIFRNFLLMMAALISILIISYTKATCDMLAGKLSINPNTGEVSDPFLFDRLKASLLCGLGNLPIGLFAVMWNKWFGQRSSTIQQQSSHLSLIGIICVAMLLPFVPDLKLSYDVMTLFSGDETFWFTLLGSIFLGTVPFTFSLLQLNRKNPPEYLTTCNLGAIIFMGLAEWLSEPVQTTIVRWEVIGYLILSFCCIFLSMALR